MTEDHFSDRIATRWYDLIDHMESIADRYQQHPNMPDEIRNEMIEKAQRLIDTLKQ
jgi:uncharacterized protein Yka (UPF0111/DUF47 family)